MKQYLSRLGLLTVLLAIVFAPPVTQAQQEVYQCYYTYTQGVPGQPTCSVQATMQAPNTAGALTLVAGGTAQTLFTTNEVLHGCAIMNPSTATEQGIGTAESITIDFTGKAAAAGAGTATTILEAGQSVGCASGNTTSISWIATTTGHKINASKW